MSLGPERLCRPVALQTKLQSHSWSQSESVDTPHRDIGITADRVALHAERFWERVHAIRGLAKEHAWRERGLFLGCDAEISRTRWGASRLRPSTSGAVGRSGCADTSPRAGRARPSVLVIRVWTRLVRDPHGGSHDERLADVSSAGSAESESSSAAVARKDPILGCTSTSSMMLAVRATRARTASYACNF